MSHHQMHPQQMIGKRLPAPPGLGPPGTTFAPQQSSSSSTNAGAGALHSTSAVRPPPPETALTRRLTDLLLLAPISLNLAEMTAADWRLIARLENETQLEQAARVHRCTVSCRGENLVALHCVQWNSMRCSFRLLYVRNKGDLFSQGQHNHAQTAPLWELPMMPTMRLPRPRIVHAQQAQALHGTSVVRPPPPEALTAQTQPIPPSQSVPAATSTTNEPSSANDQQPKRRRNRKLGPEWRLVHQLANESELRQLGFQPNGRRKKQYVDCPWGVPCQARLCLQKDQLTLYESGQHSHIRQPAASNEEGGPSGEAPSSSDAGGSIAANRPAEAQMVETQSSDHQQHKSRKRRAKEDAKISDELMRQKQQQPLKMVFSLGVNVGDDNAASTTTPIGTTTTTAASSTSCSSANNDNNAIVRNFLISTSNTRSSNGISRGENGGSTVITVASSHFSARTTTSTTCIVHNGQGQSNISKQQDIAVANLLCQLAPTPPLFNLLLAGGQLPVAATTAASSSPSCSSSSDASTAANFFEPLTPENSVVGHHQQRTTESVQTQTSDGASTTAVSATTTPHLLIVPVVPEIVIISSDDEEEEEQPTKKVKESQGQQQSKAMGQVPAAPEGQAMGGGEHPAVDGNQAVGQQIAADKQVVLTGLGRGGEEAAAVNIAHEPQNTGGATSQQQQQVEGVVPEAAESGGQQGGVIVQNIVVTQEQQSSCIAIASALFAACSSSNVPTTSRGELANNANNNVARADQAVQAGPVEQQQQSHHFHLFNLAELFRQVCWRFQMQFRVEGAKFVIKRVDPDQRIGDLLLFEDRGPLIVVTEYRERHSVQPDGRLLGQWVQKQSRWVKSDIEQFMTAVRGRCDQMLTSQPHLEP